MAYVFCIEDHLDNVCDVFISSALLHIPGKYSLLISSSSNRLILRIMCSKGSYIDTCGRTDKNMSVADSPRGVGRSHIMSPWIWRVSIQMPLCSAATLAKHARRDGGLFVRSPTLLSNSSHHWPKITQYIAEDPHLRPFKNGKRRDIGWRNRSDGDGWSGVVLRNGFYE